MEAKPLTYIASEQPRVMVVDGSKVVRRLLEQLLRADLAGVSVVACATGAEAMHALAAGPVDFVSTALRLPDMDGMELARHVREQTATQTYVPIVIVSGDVDERLVNRELSGHVTDYFDKALGLSALAAFIQGYVNPRAHATGTVLYVEDSRVVAVTTRRLLERHGFTVRHVTSVEDALELLDAARAAGAGPGVDVALSDVKSAEQAHRRRSAGSRARRIRLWQGRVAGADHDRRPQSAATRPRCCAQAPTISCSSRSTSAC